MFHFFYAIEIHAKSIILSKQSLMLYTNVFYEITTLKLQIIYNFDNDKNSGTILSLIAKILQL